MIMIWNNGRRNNGSKHGVFTTTLSKEPLCSRNRSSCVHSNGYQSTNPMEHLESKIRQERDAQDAKGGDNVSIFVDWLRLCVRLPFL